MWRLVIGLVRARPAQVLTMLVLTALAAAIAVAGPWFAFASMSSAAAADVAAAPAEQRILSVRQSIHIDGDPQAAVDRFAGQIRDLVTLPSAEPVTGLTLTMSLIRGLRSDTVPVAYRDQFCAHVKLQGPCPSAPGEVAISATAGQRLGLRPGDRATERVSLGSPTVSFRIVSVYTPVEPTGPYWSNRLYHALTGADPLFTPIATFGSAQLADPTVTYDVQMPDELLRSDGDYDLAATLNTAGARMGREHLTLINSSGPLLTAVARDRATVRTSVTVALVQVLVVAWFAIGLAGRYTARDRRGDTALLKLRGAPPAGQLQLSWGQHLVPLTGGVIIGLPLGFLLARVLAGPVGNASDRRSALLLSLAAALAVLLGGLLVLAVLETLAQRRPVAELLRQATSGRGDWKSGLIDLLLLAIAVAGIYQARVGTEAGGFALAAPALVALAVAVLLARLLSRVADRGGGAALKSGRVRLGLTAAQMSRRPGTDRLFALVVVTVAMFTTALGGWLADGEHRATRSAAELGAQRVLTVQADNRTLLQQAVHRADPQGKRAMAAVVDSTQLPPVLAVDSARLAAVARWRPEFGPVATLAAATADDPGPAPLPPITGDHLTVRLGHTGDVPASLALIAQNEGTGAGVRVPFGELGPGEQTLTAPVTGCSAAPGCRILRWELTAPTGPAGRVEAPRGPTAVTVRGLTQQNPAAVVLDGAALSDINRWRGGTSAAAMDVDTSGGVLRMAVDESPSVSVTTDYRVWAIDVPLPLPVVLGGAVPDDWRFGEPGLSLPGEGPIPVRVAGTARALPVLGSDGVLTDLDATRRLIGESVESGTFQVWLAPEAGPELVGALERNGLTVLDDESVTDRQSRLAQQGPSAGARFVLLATTIGLLLAVLSIAVAGAVDWRTRLDEMTALRVQGLPRRAAVVASWAGTAGLVLAALAGGLIAAALARPVAGTTVPPFTDGWAVLPPPGPLSVLAVALGALLALILLGLAGWLSTLPLLRRVREGA